jgi:hypothetical protein
VVAGAFQITFRAKMHVNDIFLFFKNHFWHQHIKTIQTIQTILNFSEKKNSNFLGTQPQPRFQTCFKPWQPEWTTWNLLPTLAFELLYIKKKFKYIKIFFKNIISTAFSNITLKYKLLKLIKRCNLFKKFFFSPVSF